MTHLPTTLWFYIYLFLFQIDFYQNRWCKNQSRHFDQFQRKNKGENRNYGNRKMTKEKTGTGPADWEQGSIWRWLGLLYFISILLPAKTIIVYIFSSVHVLFPPQTNTLSLRDSQQILSNSHTPPITSMQCKLYLYFNQGIVKYVYLWTLWHGLHSIFHIDLPNIVRCVLSSDQSLHSHPQWSDDPEVQPFFDMSLFFSFPYV